MGLTRIRCDWKLMPPPARRCGPQDFARSLLGELHAVQETEVGAWVKCASSDESVAQVIELAYYASLLEEEGRAPRFRVVFGVEKEDRLPFPPVARFDPPLPIGDVWDLVKIAPAFSRRNVALWLADWSGAAGQATMECRGLLNFGAASQRIMVGYPDPLASATRTVLDQPTYLKLSIEGSGHLRASFGLLWEQTLKGGQIRPTITFSMTPPLPPVFLDIERIIRRRCAERYPDLRLADYVLQNAREITHLWTRILEQVIAAQHGGALIVLPDATTSLAAIRRRYNIADGVPVYLDLGAVLVEFSASCARLAALRSAMSAGAQPVALDELHELQNEWFVRRNALYAAVNTIAGLTEVDGCVVLDRGLRVHLFGGKIRNARPDHPSAPLRPLRDWYQPDESLDSSLARLGTRNQSACGFCREYPHALAFVVSQDGDLRVYCSDTDCAYAFEALAAC
ncbi:MAG: putative sensor domain DACNV-containing protein [Planctomycetaceae bacterium]